MILTVEMELNRFFAKKVEAIEARAKLISPRKRILTIKLKIQLHFDKFVRERKIVLM